MDIQTNADGSVLLSRDIWEQIKELIAEETSEDPSPPGQGFIALAELLDLEDVIPDYGYYD